MDTKIVIPPVIEPVTFESEMAIQDAMEKDPNHPAWNGVKYSAASRKRVVQIGRARLYKKYNKPNPQKTLPIKTRIWAWFSGISND